MNRIWIYQADRNLTNEEVTEIDPLLGQFTRSWQAHGHPLKASFEILHNRFIIIKVDNEIYAASGCSIDKSVHLIQELGRKLDINFFNREQITFLTEEGVQHSTLSELENDVIAGKISHDSLVFNNTFEFEEQIRDSWPAPLQNTPFSRFIKPS